ncbi:MAG: lamin tail domain-containing protein, partial [Candidatus Sumerlaeota bacterium]|nr:lamin tail domain-containing protein [Candidatus Sumerlaeota bacterium]
MKQAGLIEKNIYQFRWRLGCALPYNLTPNGRPSRSVGRPQRAKAARRSGTACHSAPSWTNPSFYLLATKVLCTKAAAPREAPWRLGVALLFMMALAQMAPAQIVINEIHYDPDNKKESVEFVELYNAGAADVDLSGWVISGGISYAFPQGTTITAQRYVVVGQDGAAIAAKFGVSCLGPFAGKLDNDADLVKLRAAAGALQDEVEYKLGFPWPCASGGEGRSMELINPLIDNNLGGAWQASGYGASIPMSTATLIAAQSNYWHYRKGASEPSSPSSAWRQIGFGEDSTWRSGRAAIGYGEEFINTVLDDMQSSYTTFYLRKTFNVADATSVTTLILELQYDDGVNVWINGARVAGLNVSGATLPCTATAILNVENRAYQTIILANPRAYLRTGTNVLAAQVLNSKKNSGDAFFDAILTAMPGGFPATGPTPGRRNSAYSNTTPPMIRQVSHAPDQPKSGEDVLITAKITDPDGVSSAALMYQIVDPGHYIALDDSAYMTNWTAMAMRDDGLGGDAIAGDGIYTCVMPAAMQIHRRMVRYRIAAVDGAGAAVTVPYPDDPQPNFAWFVYDGVPEWAGSWRPGVQPETIFTTQTMRSLPVFHVLCSKSEIEKSTWLDHYTANEYPYMTTLVFEGRVYDHVPFRMRGGVWRYAMRKNMWKFNFHRP